MADGGNRELTQVLRDEQEEHLSLAHHMADEEGMASFHTLMPPRPVYSCQLGQLCHAAQAR